MSVKDNFSIEAIHENNKINSWVKNFIKSPMQINKIHESDAELIQLENSNKVLAVTIDTVCEEIEFGLYNDPYTIGWVSIMANFSDLAAVGAFPLGICMSISWLSSHSDEFKNKAAQGMNDACMRLNTHIIGGDTNESKSFSITGCAVGIVEKDKILTRKGMQKGDLVFLSAPAGLGNLLAASIFLDANHNTEQFYRPTARIKEGEIISGLASACIDTSDGVFYALDQLARINQLGINIDTSIKDLVLEQCAKIQNIPLSSFLAGYHGEYELVFTVPKNKLDNFIKSAGKYNWKPILIGEVTEMAGVFYKNQEINTTFFRNLLEEVNFNVENYIKLLIAESNKII